MGYEFDWDPAKAELNLRKHGVSFEEASTVFGDWFGINMPDPKHSVDEQRYILLGMSDRQRLLVVGYTDRPPHTRLISTRLATRRERKQYEEDIG